MVAPIYSAALLLSLILSLSRPTAFLSWRIETDMWMSAIAVLFSDPMSYHTTFSHQVLRRAKKFEDEIS